jgi:hypothetical protein
MAKAAVESLDIDSDKDAEEGILNIGDGDD